MGPRKEECAQASGSQAKNHMPVRFLEVNNPGWPGVAEVKGWIHVLISVVTVMAHTYNASPLIML